MKTIKEIYEGIDRQINITSLPTNVLNRLIDLSELNYQPRFGLNEKVIHNNKPMYIFAMRVAMSSHPNPEVQYLLSENYNRQSTTNEGVSDWIEECTLIDFKENEDLKINMAMKLLKENGYKVEKQS